MASEMFDNAFTDGGTLVATCGFCGKTHFATYDQNMDVGEEDLLKQKADLYPDKYQEWDCSSVGIGNLDCKTIVWQCPCDKRDKYESFIWEHRREIMKYLKARINEVKKAVDADDNALSEFEL